MRCGEILLRRGQVNKSELLNELVEAKDISKIKENALKQ